MPRHQPFSCKKQRWSSYLVTQPPKSPSNPIWKLKPETAQVLNPFCKSKQLASSVDMLKNQMWVHLTAHTMPRGLVIEGPSQVGGLKHERNTNALGAIRKKLKRPNHFQEEKHFRGRSPPWLVVVSVIIGGTKVRRLLLDNRSWCDVSFG